jgi:putative iron-regulated protein
MFVSPRPLFRALVLLPLLASGCGDDGGSSTRAASALEREVVAQYVAILRASYADTVQGAGDLEAASAALVEAPSADTLEAARAAWRAAREPYGQTEAYRFYGGPIDDEETGPEGYINGWPLDESFIDYVEGGVGTGIINQVEQFPSLDADVLISENENGGEDYLSTGYHAVEFLLWGQDLNANGPGERPYTDYVESEQGPGEHAARRATYLKTASALLVSQLGAVADAWAEGAPYAEAFLANEEHASLKAMLRGIEQLTGKELSGERMNAAIKSGDQEDEHSCFSDNTHVDYAMNALGVENVYLGRYGELDGPGIDELVLAVSPELDAQMKDALAAMKDAVAAVPAPIDQVLLSAQGRSELKNASDRVVDVHDVIVAITAALKL